MRNINRIEQILKEIESYWKKNPDLRLGQIVCNIGKEKGFDEPFYLEDDDLLKQLKKKNDANKTKNSKKDSILETKSPFSNKWFTMLSNVICAELDLYENEIELRRYSRICEYLAKEEEFGDAMTVRDMISNVERLGIMNYDGIGYFVSYEDFNKTPCFDIEDIEYLKAHEETDFVIWYNK